jgi:hypothetical protein
MRKSCKPNSRELAPSLNLGPVKYLIYYFNRLGIQILII